MTVKIFAVTGLDGGPDSRVTKFAKQSWFCHDRSSNVASREACIMDAVTERLPTENFNRWKP
jgi:hypothetical protein